MQRWATKLAFCVALATGFAQDAARADEPATATQATLVAGIPSTLERAGKSAEIVKLPDDWRSHPMAPALEFALSRYKFVRENVRDFTCILVRRERINGRLKEYEFALTKVRARHVEDDRDVQPYSVYMKYMAPAKYRNRQVLFVSGQNDGKILVRNGGRRFSYVTVSVDPDSEAAKRESNYAITEMGLENISRRLIDQAIADIQNDPTGENTQVAIVGDVRVDERLCTRIEVLHPERGEKFGYHIARIYVDDELQVPIRVAGYDWPEREGGDPMLIEEFTYRKLKLNVGLSDADFDSALLNRSPDR